MDYSQIFTATREIVKQNLNLFSKNAFDINILPGWKIIISDLLNNLQTRMLSESGRLQITQITEKFGELNIVFGSEGLTAEAISDISEIIANKCADAASTCAICGKQGILTYSPGWPDVRCVDHIGIKELVDEEDIQILAKHEDLLAKILGQF